MLARDETLIMLLLLAHISLFLQSACFTGLWGLLQEGRLIGVHVWLPTNSGMVLWSRKSKCLSKKWRLQRNVGQTNQNTMFGAIPQKWIMINHDLFISHFKKQIPKRTLHKPVGATPHGYGRVSNFRLIKCSLKIWFQSNHYPSIENELTHSRQSLILQLILILRLHEINNFDMLLGTSHMACILFLFAI